MVFFIIIILIIKWLLLKDFGSGEKESTKPDPISFPLAKNNPQFLKDNKTKKNLNMDWPCFFLVSNRWC